MRQEFDKIVASYGHDIYLQRLIHDENSDTDESVYSQGLEIHTVRFSVTPTRSLTGLKQEHQEGVLNTSVRVYYFRWDARPFDNDRIYEIEPEAKDGQSVWIIDGAVPMYGVGGKLVYWAVGATRIRPN